MAEPAEEDVSQLTADRLAAIITRKGYDQSVAWTIGDALVAAGVTLPPEPDTPPEPQERWRTGSGETGDAHIVYGADGMRADCYRSERSIGIEDKDFARSLVALLRLDAKYEDQGGVAKALEAAQKRGDAFQVKFEEQCQHPRSHLVDVETLIDWAAEWATDNDVCEGTYDAIENASKSESVRQAFEQALSLWADQLTYRQAGNLVRTWVITWDADGNPLADGNPIYGGEVEGK